HHRDDRLLAPVDGRHDVEAAFARIQPSRRFPLHVTPGSEVLAYSPEDDDANPVIPVGLAHRSRERLRYLWRVGRHRPVGKRHERDARYPASELLPILLFVYDIRVLAAIYGL